MPGNLAQNGIVGSSRIGNGNLAVADLHIAFALHEVAVELGGIATLKSAKVLGQSAVERIRDQGVPGELMVTPPREAGRVRGSDPASRSSPALPAPSGSPR